MTQYSPSDVSFHIPNTYAYIFCLSTEVLLHYQTEPQQLTLNGLLLLYFGTVYFISNCEMN